MIEPTHPKNTWKVIGDNNLISRDENQQVWNQQPETS